MIILIFIVIILFITNLNKNNNYANKNHIEDSWGEDFDEKKYNKKVKSLQIKKTKDTSNNIFKPLGMILIGFIILSFILKISDKQDLIIQLGLLLLGTLIIFLFIFIFQADSFGEGILRLFGAIMLLPIIFVPVCGIMAFIVYYSV